MTSEAIPATCPECGKPTDDLVVVGRETPTKPGPPRLGRLIGLNDCQWCKLLQGIEFARLQDLNWGGKGEFCPQCLQPLTKQGRRSLKDLKRECPWCHEWKLQNCQRAGGPPAEAARRAKKEESMTSDTRALVVADPNKAAIQLKARFPKDLESADAAAQFVEVAIAYRLDPFMGELVPFQGRPYVTVRGLERQIAERFPGQLLSITADMAPPEDYEKYRVPESDWLAFVTVQRKGQQPIKRYATVRKSETAGGQGYKPVEKEPWDMAMKRARHRALREAFPDAISLQAFEMVGAAEEQPGNGEVVDSTARDVTGEQPPAQVAEATAPSEPAPVDEKGPDDPEAEQRKRFWATTREIKYKTRAQVHGALGIRHSEHAMSEVWLAEADRLGIPRPRAWAIATDCLQSVTALVQKGESLDQAVAAVDPIGQLRRAAEAASVPEEAEDPQQQEELPFE